MDFKKQRPTYRRSTGEGRLTAPGNHSSRSRARATASDTARRPDHVKALGDVARASASYTTARNAVRKPAAAHSSVAAEHALEDARRRRARVARLAIAVVTVAVLVAIGVSVFALRKDAVVGIEGNAFTHIIGQRVDLTEPVEIERRDNAWVAVGQNGTFTMDGRPLYLEQSGEVIFGDRAMVVLPARQGIIRQIPARTRASFEGGIASLRSNDGAVEPIESGFIYDGIDTYTLLTEATIQTGAGEYALPALSCVEAVNGGAVYVYDYVADAVQVFDAGTAKLLVDDGYMSYEVDLLSDTMTVDDVSQLLLGSASSMPSIFDAS